MKQARNHLSFAMPSDVVTTAQWWCSFARLFFGVLSRKKMCGRTFVKVHAGEALNISKYFIGSPWGSRFSNPTALEHPNQPYGGVGRWANAPQYTSAFAINGEAEMAHLSRLELV